jgi:hypothetical protein
VVIPVAENERRTALAIGRNVAILLVVVVAYSWLVAGRGHHVATDTCTTTGNEIVRAEARYHTAIGGYTDLPGLRYAGYLTDRATESANIRLVGPAGAATGYSVERSSIC